MSAGISEGPTRRRVRAPRLTKRAIALEAGPAGDVRRGSPPQRRKPASRPQARRPGGRNPAGRQRPAGTGRNRSGARPSRGRRALGWLIVATAALVTVGFLLVLARLTLTPQPEATEYVTGNTRPGETMRRYLDRPSVRAAGREIGGNLLLLAPLGILLPVVVRQLRGLFRVTAAAALLSLTIEITQGVGIVGRSFDTDDVILNTAGAALAYLLVGRRLARWVRPHP